MPRVRVTPVDPQSLARWDGDNQRSRKVAGHSGDDGIPRMFGPYRQQKDHPVVANGSMIPTSFLEALMQTVPGMDQLGSSEELVELAADIEYAMQTLLTERERFVVECIVFEGLSLRDVERRWGRAWGKTQVARIRDSAFAKLAASDALRRHAGLPVD